MIHKAKYVNTGRKERQKNQTGKRKPGYVVQYSKYRKGWQGRSVPKLLLNFKETLKWLKKALFCIISCALLKSSCTEN